MALTDIFNSVEKKRQISSFIPATLPDFVTIPTPTPTEPVLPDLGTAPVDDKYVKSARLLLETLNKGLADDNPTLRSAFYVELYNQLGSMSEEASEASVKPIVYSDLPHENDIRSIGKDFDVTNSIMSDTQDLTLDNYKDAAKAVAHTVSMVCLHSKDAQELMAEMRRQIASNLQLPTADGPAIAEELPKSEPVPTPACRVDLAEALVPKIPDEDEPQMC